MINTATPFARTQDSNPHSALTVSVLDQRLKSRILRGEGIEKAIENSLVAVHVSKGESLDQLNEKLLARAPSQTEEMDAFTEGRAEAVKSHSAMDRGLVGPPQRRRGYCSKGYNRIHSFYTQGFPTLKNQAG
jgi:hypothetical protein